MTNKSYYENLTDKFDKLIKMEHKSFSLAGLQISAIAILSFILIYISFESAANFSVEFRTFMFFFLITVSAAVFIYFFVIPYAKSFKLFHKSDYVNAAKKVGVYYPHIKDELLNAFQLITIDAENKNYSANLRDAAFQKIYLKTEETDFAEAVSFQKSKRLFKFTLTVFAAVLLLILFVPSLNSAAYRAINFSQEFIPPVKFNFNIKPGNSEITKGDSVKIKIEVLGNIPKSVKVAVKHIEQTEFEFKELSEDSSGLYIFILPSVRSSFEYFAMSEDVQSNIYNVKVIDKPIIRTLDVVIEQPAYSGLSKIILENNGNFTALKGSKASYKISATKELKTAKLFFNDSTEFRLDITGRNASGEFKALKDADYMIILLDKENNQNENPVQYSIKILSDENPEIKLYEPNETVMLGLDNRVRFLASVKDDYGFSKLLLKYKINDVNGNSESEEKSIKLGVSKNLKEQGIEYVWNLLSEQIKETQFITCYLEIFDNDYISGPKSARSKIITIKIPTLNEIFAETDKLQNESETKLTETLKDADELKNELQKISQELKQNSNEITWQEKEKIEKAIEKYEELLSKTEDVQRDLSEMQNEMQKNDLISEKTMEKYLELQELFKELSSEEMLRAMEKLQESLQNMNRNQIQKAAEEFKFNEEQFKKSIERTLNLLKRASIEQKMDEISKRTEEMTNELDSLSNQTKNSDLKDKQAKNDLIKQQKKESQKLNDLEKALEQLQEKMKEFKDLPNEQMNKSLEDFEKQRNHELSQQAEQNLQKGEKQKAMENQNSLSQNMQKMKKQMNEMQQQMQNKNQMQTFNEMRKTLSDLLTLSKEQEELKKNTQIMEQSSDSFSDAAQKQISMQSSMDKILKQLADLGKKTFAITPEMGKALGKAQREMQQSTMHLKNRSSSQSTRNQNEAMAGLNEAALQLKTSMENMMNGSGSGSGMMSMMQQLQQLSQQQMGLNNLTQQMQQGSLTQQQQAAMDRLAQQQDMIRKSLEQLNKESKLAGESKKIPADLEKIVNEMKEVVSDLRSQSVDNDLIQKQEKILSKMLDAQRSINDRDFEKRRESKSGENIAGNSPAQLNFQDEDKFNRLKDELQKAVQEGYSKDYEELIRKYYEALEKKNYKN